jgi:hypothetical protein
MGKAFGRINRFCRRKMMKMSDYLKVAQAARQRYQRNTTTSTSTTEAPDSAGEVLTLEVTLPKETLTPEDRPSGLDPNTRRLQPDAYASPSQTPTWEDHLADLLDLSRYPLLPCEECGGSNFAKGKVKHWREQWLCRDCVKGLSRAEVERLERESRERASETGDEDPLSCYPSDPKELLDLLQQCGVFVWEREPRRMDAFNTRKTGVPEEELRALVERYNDRLLAAWREGYGKQFGPQDWNASVGLQAQSADGAKP